MQKLISKKPKTIHCNGKIISLEKPLIMGILNVTPDSFSDGGLYTNLDSALNQVEKMLKEGAQIIDIGAQSTRPNSTLISAEEEIARLGNIIAEIKRKFPEALISLDTFYSETVKFGFEQGLDIINDISAGQFDQEMFSTVAKTGLPYILMHGNSTYEKMHEKGSYEDILIEVNRFIFEKVQKLREYGVKDIIIDPGFGFGKKVEDQFKILEEIEHFGLGTFPVLAGISRKSFIYKPLQKSPKEVGAEMEILHKKLLQKNVNILRVHDVAEARKAVEEY